jgi:hypothetical protein
MHELPRAVRLIAILLVVSSCAPANVRVSSPPSPAPATPFAPVTGCPITIGRPGTQPPAPLNPDVLPVSYVDTWYGNDAIWIRLPKGGVIPAAADQDKSTISAKFPWWRVLAGQLEVSASRFDNDVRLPADVGTVAEYGPTGFVPSGLVFGGPGCWEITGAIQGRSLTFIASVERSP